MASGKFEVALAQLRAAVHLHPTSAEIHRGLGDVLLALGEHDLAKASHDLALSLAPDNTKIATAVLAQRAWQTDANRAVDAESSAAIEQTITTGRKPRNMLESRGMHIGILWDQCFTGPAMDFVLPVLESLENVILYRLNRRSDRATELARTAVMRFQDLQNVDAATLDRIISGDRPYAIINLCGGGEESAYPLFSGPGAPVTLTWLSEPLPERQPTSEYVVSASATADIDFARFDSDKIIKLPQLLAWRFPATGIEAETVAPLPRDTKGFVTFGAIADMRRICAQTVSLWARALWAVPESILVIGGIETLQRSVTDKLLACFANFGVINRIKFHTPDSNVRSQLDLMAHIDVLLDSTPVSGMSEIAEALWMGVPAVTLKSQRRAGRSGTAILNAAGRPDWVADNAESFVAIASNLAMGEELAAIRANLREATAASPLCDAKSFAIAFENSIKSAAFS
jgi:predicted O-linked N-acetylglucosamine transferase (SPINDLY family)